VASETKTRLRKMEPSKKKYETIGMYKHMRSFQVSSLQKGCQMVRFHNFGKIWRALEWKMFVIFYDFFRILRPLGIIYGLLV
jgi:hypothetical protein